MTGEDQEGREIEPLTFRAFCERHDHEVMGRYYANEPVSDIIRSTGLSAGTVYRIISRFGGPRRRNKRHGAVGDMAASQVPPDRIAHLTGYSSRHVRRILNNLGDR